jgi:hypothetical protein
LEGEEIFWQNSGATRREIAKLCLSVIARSEATKQSILSLPHCHAARSIASLTLAMTIVLLFEN